MISSLRNSKLTIPLLRHEDVLTFRSKSCWLFYRGCQATDGYSSPEEERSRSISTRSPRKSHLFPFELAFEHSSPLPDPSERRGCLLVSQGQALARRHGGRTMSWMPIQSDLGSSSNSGTFMKTAIWRFPLDYPLEVKKMRLLRHVTLKVLPSLPGVCKDILFMSKERAICH